MPQLIIPFIAAIGVPGLVTAGGALTTLGSVLSAGIGIAASLALNMLFKPSGPKPQDVKGVVRSSVPVRRRHYGRRRVGGHMAFIETLEGDLWQIVMFGQGPIDEIEQYIVDDNYVTLSSNYVTEEPYDGDSVEIRGRLGATNQVAFDSVVTAFPDIWSANHRLRGIACALVVSHAVKQERFAKVYPSRIVAINALIRGVLVYDPRDEETAWTQNLALQLRDYIIHPDGARIDPALVDDDLFSAAADICDENVTIKAGGTIKRYHGGMSYDLDEEPKSVIERFLSAMDGRLFLTSAGKVGLQAGKWITPTVTIKDEHIISYEFEGGAGPHRRANEVTVKYTHADAKWGETTADPWRDEAAISTEGLVRPLAPEIYAIEHHNHARRIAKIIAHRASPRWVGTIRTTLFGMEAYDQRWIVIQITEEDLDESFEVVGWRLDTGSMTVLLDVQSFGSEAYDFNPATEEGTAPKVPEEEEVSATPFPSSVTATAVAKTISGVSITVTDNDTIYDNVTETNNNTPTDTPYSSNVESYSIRVTVPEPPKPSLDTQVQYEESMSGDWETIPFNDATNTASSPSVKRGVTYRARARYKGVGAVSEWVMSSGVTIPS